MTASFTIGERDFLLDGEPFRVISGAMHYFRIHPDQWADRIRKARQMGLNTIETYVPWNAHAPHEDVFDLTGGLDLGRYLDLVAAEGMYAIVRPGPYICAEWTNGGLPAWLLRRPGIGIRRNEPQFLTAVDRYLRQLAPVIVPRQIDRGGPVILVQVENEYGAYGDDPQYLRTLVDLNRAVGVSVPLVTVDQPMDSMLERGSLPELHKTASFGSRTAERLQVLRRHQPTGPMMCGEFWDGWFDDWGGSHRTTPAEDSAAELKALLAAGASVNIYMFHGGTNFGFTNGANDKGTYHPVITSYDYDAPLSESGEPTSKYWAFREAIAGYAPVSADVPSPSPSAPAFRAPVTATLPLWDLAASPQRWRRHGALPDGATFDHNTTFTLYRTEIRVDGPATLEVTEVRDRVQVFLDRTPVGVLERERHDTAIRLPDPAQGTLDLLVEDQGGVDYGPRLGEPKGLIGPATLNGDSITHWQTWAVDLSDLAGVTSALRPLVDVPAPAVGPLFAFVRFDLPADAGSGSAPPDLFLNTAGWGKGAAWINGFCLGRYWNKGPQRTLYVPGPVLRWTGNELIVLEQEARCPAEAVFVSGPDLGDVASAAADVRGA